MIAVENDYKPIIYEQPFSSHINENQLELLHNYYIEPIHSTQTAQETNEINTTNKSNENDKTKCLNTNHIYQNIQKYTLSSNITFRTFRILRNQRYDITNTRKSIPRK